MARPRVFHLDDGGEVVLRNVNKDMAEKIGAFLCGEEPSSTTLEIGDSVLEENECDVSQVPSETPDTALGMRKADDGKWQVVEVKYNAITGEARVIKIQNLETNAIAHGVYKLRAYQLGIV